MKKISYLIPAIYFCVMIFIPAIVGFCFLRDASSNHLKNPKAHESIKIKYLDTSVDKVKDCGLEDYLVGVLAFEMPAEYQPEALKAQAVAARSYILSKMGTETKEHPKAVVCTDPNHCKGYIDKKTAKDRWDKKNAEEYWQKLENAVKDTEHEYMVCGEDIVEAFFFARSGGRTENSEDVWGSSRPYLKSVVSEVDKNHPEFISRVEISVQELRKKLGIDEKKSGEPLKIEKITHTQGGNIESISLDGKSFKGTELRKILGLKSADFEILEKDNLVTFIVRGYGHGVGMSQFGANEMAKSGAKYTEILSHYYTNIQIVKK